MNDNVRWFCGRTNIGIVRTVDPYCGPCYYIGVVSGKDEAHDIQDLEDWGSTFPVDAGDTLFGLNK